MDFDTSDRLALEVASLTPEQSTLVLEKLMNQNYGIPLFNIALEMAINEIKDGK